MSDEPRDRRSSEFPVEVLLDVFVYAPIGLALSVRRLWPELVATGRQQAEQQVRLARVVGQFAMQIGKSQGAKLLGDAFDLTRATKPVGEAAADRAAEHYASSRPGGDVHSGEDPGLPIERYTTLPASLVIPRLAGLSDAELDEVRAYEDGHRQRQTILMRIAQITRDRLAAVAPEPPPPVRDAPARKTPARKTPARKTPARKTPARKTQVRKTQVRKAPAARAPSR